MRNTIISLLLLFFVQGTLPLDEYHKLKVASQKVGCLDEYAVNYCYDCDVEGGQCLYDNQYEHRCEDPYVKWPRRYTPIKEFKDVFRVFTLTSCWDYWEVRIYDFVGNEIWRSYEPNEVWSVQTNGEYVEAGEYYLSIKAETQGSTKKIDILADIEIYYND